MEDQSEKKTENKKQVFKPGTKPVHIKVTQYHAETNPSTFSNSYQKWNGLLKQLSIRSFPLHEKAMGANAEDSVDWERKILRMGNLLLAKKLATALTKHEAARFSQVSQIAQMYMSAPAFLITVVDGFGPIRTPNIAADPVGNVATAVNSMCRALSEPEVDGRYVNLNTTWFINTAWPWSIQALYDMCLGIVNTWARTSGWTVLNIGGVDVRLRVPEVLNGMDGYAALVQAVPNKTVLVTRAIAVARLLEPLLGAANMNPALVAALGIQETVVVDWSRDDLMRNHARYIEEVESTMDVLSMGMAWTRVDRLANTGELWQLTQMEGEMCISPFALPGGALEMGYMMTEERNFYQNVREFGLIDHSEAPSTALMTFVNKHVKA